MSILKSNNASSLDEPITPEWLKTTCIFQEFIPDRMIKSGRIKPYCELGSKPKKTYSTDIYLSIYQAFIQGDSFSLPWLKNIEYILYTKTIWYGGGKCMLNRDLKNKRDVITFIDDVHNIMSDL